MLYGKQISLIMGALVTLFVFSPSQAFASQSLADEPVYRACPLFGSSVMCDTGIFSQKVTYTPTLITAMPAQQTMTADLGKRAEMILSQENKYSSLPTVLFDPPHSTPTPVPTPAPSSTPLPIVKEQVLAASASATPVSEHPLNPDVIFNLINEHRSQLNLPAYEKNEELCKVAQSRGPELANELFVTHQLHSGLYNRNLPYWITENMIWQPTETAAVTWWLNSPIHRKAIEADHKYSCGTCVGNICAQLFTSFIPK